MQAKSLTLCPLFDSMSLEQINDVLSDYMYAVRHIHKGETILHQGDTYSFIMILLEGKVQNSMSQMSEKNISIESIEAPNILAPAIFYSSHNIIPVDVVAVEEVKILPMQKADFTLMLRRNEKIMTNFISIISTRASFLSEKVRDLGFGTIKSNLATYLYEIMQQKESSSFEIAHTQQQLADMFGVTRPALAKAISQMIQQGVIDSKGKHFTILSPKALKVMIV